MKQNQVLIQQEKVHIDCEKGAQISILANKTATHTRPNIIIKEFKQIIHFQMNNTEIKQFIFLF